MAIINCPECGKQVSELAEACPNCGFPIKQKNEDYSEKERDEDEESNKELWKDDIIYGILSIMISFFSTIVAFRINDGVGLVFPLVLYIISAVLSSRQRKLISLIGLIFSALGIALIAVVFIFF